jgi:hypothetical protein
MDKDKTWLQWKEEGCELMNKNQWLEAMNCFTRAIRVKNDEASLYLNRATCQLKLKKISLACEDAETGIRLDSENLELYRILAEAQKGMLSDMSFAAKKTTRCPRCSPGDNKAEATSKMGPTMFDLRFGSSMWPILLPPKSSESNCGT